jgi:uncharacterized phage protein (TIGR02220 family)
LDGEATVKTIQTFKAGEQIPGDGKFLFFNPTTEAYHYEVPLKTEKTKSTAEDKDLIREIVDYLNRITNAKFFWDSRSTQRPIIARINEGRTFEDFKKVIDLKFQEWGNDPHWSKYLRPETLFGPKFDSYLLAPGSSGSDPFEDLDKEIGKIK